MKKLIYSSLKCKDFFKIYSRTQSPARVCIGQAIRPTHGVNLAPTGTHGVDVAGTLVITFLFHTTTHTY